MSKMPAKKKSCFQITSVTQAQVAASSITDDTESLDDPDESRTEDVSSEIFDLSRADIDTGVCDRSSSEETLNNVGEVGAAVMALHLPQEQEAATSHFNGGHAFRSAGRSHVNQNLLGGSVPVPAASKPSISTLASQQPTTVNAVPAANVSPTSVSQTPPAAPSTTTTVSYSSRFRVIKLDHGTGEPFRRGRWTCTEFYERDSEGSGMSRTVDSIKHTVTLDHNADRDTGLGATGDSVVASSTLSTQAQESTGDSGYSTIHHGHPPEPQQQGYGLAPQIGNGGSAFQPMGYSAVVSQVNVQPTVPQTLHPTGLNGAPQGGMLKKDPLATQAQQFAYSAHPSGTLPSQLDYLTLHQPQGSSTQTLPMSSLSVGPPVSQGPSPVITPVGPSAQVLGLLAQAGQLTGSLHSGPLDSVQGLLLQVGSGAVNAPLLPGSTIQHPVSQSLPSGGVGSVLAPSTASVVQNMPATVPSATNTPPGPGGLSQVQVVSSGAMAGSAGQGLPAASQEDDSRRRSDNLPQPNATLGKDFMRPFIPESLQLANPTVNSLFGIAIPMDGDEDGYHVKMRRKKTHFRKLINTEGLGEYLEDCHHVLHHILQQCSHTRHCVVNTCPCQGWCEVCYSWNCLAVCKNMSCSCVQRENLEFGRRECGWQGRSIASENCHRVLVFFISAHKQGAQNM
ncbi:TSC22 domain family protein 2 isoform X1 [Oncorhynchus mykiss]|uniref:TSC22 domain family protein 2 isoform X1 n=1 Tax=Oncorhynchus mykiss TaxID=8022 RepID=UPI00187879AC|nr:TSC22 domain family protein 2 isoform X1 [Oncorhynchus mykiss]